MHPNSTNHALTASLEAKAARQIFEGCKWLTAAEVTDRGCVPQTQFDQWLRERRIFGVEWDGQMLFASYLFGPDHQPLPGIAAVLQILDGDDARRLAAWFESTSSYLGGRSPRELIATSPELVASAAHDAIQGERYAG